MYILFVLLICVSGSFGQLQLNSQCVPSNITATPNFYFGGFIGQWRQIERIENTEESGGDCFNTTISLTSPDLRISIENSWVVNGAVMFRRGIINRNSAEPEGRFTVTYPDGTHPYIVVATDYTGFALVYSCDTNQGGNSQRVWAWKLSRTDSLTANQVSQINSAIAANPTLATASWRRTSHNQNACRSSSTIFHSSALLVLFMTFFGLKY